MSKKDEVRVTDEEVKVTSEEVEAVKRELRADVFTYNLRKPIEWEGCVYASLTFDFGSLTGADCMKIEHELAERKIIVPVPQISTDFQLLYAVRACLEPVGDDMFLSLPAKDFQSIMNHVKAYLGQASARSSGEEYIHVLKKPIAMGGCTFDTLKFNFGSLTGRDCVEIERKLSYAGVHVISAQVSRDYQVQYAIRACDEKISEEVFSEMGALDFCAICGSLQNFLLTAE